MTSSLAQAIKRKLNVLFEHADFIIFDKPANHSFHDENGVMGFSSLVNQQNNNSLWPVHRLDKMTSGCIIFAKSHDAAAEFGQLFAQHKIKKVYLAISDKKPKKKQGRIIGDMQKSRNGSWKLTTTRLNPATTQFLSGSFLPGKRLFWLCPKTGKTHQLRVALKSIGAPILGDLRYKGTHSDRGYLHAYQVVFQWKGQTIDTVCPPVEGTEFQHPEIQLSIEELKLKSIP